jgi:hypothetical protein
MMHTKTNANMLSFFYKPLCIAFLLFGLFGLIWLRSSIVKVAYDLRNLEEKKIAALTDRKALLADRAELMSLGKIDASFRKTDQTGDKYAGGYIFPDRVRVIHIKRNQGPESYRAALEMEGSK